MNSYIDIEKNARLYKNEETLGDRASAYLASVVCAMLSFLDGVLEFFSRPLVGLFLKAACTIITLVVIIGSCGAVEAGTLTFGAAAIRILGASAVTLIVFKGISE